MAELLVDVTPFRPTLREAKGRPGVFEVEGIMQRASSENQNGRVYKKAILERETKKYMDEFVKNGNAFGELDHPESPVVSPCSFQKPDFCIHLIQCQIFC